MPHGFYESCIGTLMVWKTLMDRSKDKTIRARIITAFILAVSVMIALFFYSVFAVSSIVSSVADSYRSNEFLDRYTSTLLSLETSLKTYMDIRSFESIDSYYSLRSQLELLTAEMHQKPSSDSLLLLEYKITRMAHTFLSYADRALAYRRANNFINADDQYVLAEQSYRYLSNAVNELNAQYFKQNRETYAAKKLIFDHLQRSCILLLITAIIITFLQIVNRVDTITKPLAEISEVANKLAEYDFDIPPLPVEKRDEVGNICRAFNRMIVSIREYIATIISKAEEEQRLHDRENYMITLYKDAQLKALQSQINPHFLFNTLNTGMQLAMMEGADKTSRFIEQTADFFRYNLQHQNEEATLEEEIALVDNYIYVMNVRFANKFTFTKKIESMHLSVRMPGMSLQPLVENCIKHGIADMKKGGIIALHVYDNTDICIDISDNGKGFPNDVRERILSSDDMTTGSTARDEQQTHKISSGTGIGLVNVVSRLRMFYNDKADVFDIRENDSGGTVFAIRIPYV